MKKKNNKKYLIAALVLVTLLGGFYFIYPAVQKSIYCPDEWDRVRQVYDQVSRDTFTINGEKKLLVLMK